MNEKIIVKCAVCGEEFETLKPSEWADSKIKNLDGRPYETDKFTVESTVICCPKCGYVSFDITKSLIESSSFITTKEYKSIISNARLPKKVNKFLALGYIFESQNKFFHASHAYLCACWLLEDELRKKEEQIMLEKTAHCMLKYINSASFKKHPDNSMILSIIDVLRRIGKFKSAIKLADFALKEPNIGKFLKEFLVEKEYCYNEDTNSHEILVSEIDFQKSFVEIKKMILASRNMDYKLKFDYYDEMCKYLDNIQIVNIVKGFELMLPNEVSISTKKISQIQAILENDEDNEIKENSYSIDDNEELITEENCVSDEDVEEKAENIQLEENDVYNENVDNIKQQKNLDEESKFEDFENEFQNEDKIDTDIKTEEETTVDSVETKEYSLTETEKQEMETTDGLSEGEEEVVDTSNFLGEVSKLQEAKYDFDYTTEDIKAFLNDENSNDFKEFMLKKRPELFVHNIYEDDEINNQESSTFQNDINCAENLDINKINTINETDCVSKAIEDDFHRDGNETEKPINEEIEQNVNNDYCDAKDNIFENEILQIASIDGTIFLKEIADIIGTDETTARSFALKLVKNGRLTSNDSGEKYYLKK